MGILIFVAVMIVFDIVVLLWGVDSREGPNSPEWGRRLAWAQRHGPGRRQPLTDAESLLEDGSGPSVVPGAPSPSVSRRPRPAVAPRPAPLPGEGPA